MGERKDGRLTQGAEGEAHILPACFEEVSNPLFPHLFFDLLDPAGLDERRAPCSTGRYVLAQLLIGDEVDVRPQLVVEVAFDPRGSKEVAGGASEPSKERHVESPGSVSPTDIRYEKRVGYIRSRSTEPEKRPNSFFFSLD